MEVTQRKDHRGEAAPVGARRDVERLVLIDDDELSRELLGLIAAEAGFEVESFESGQEALSYLEGLDTEGAPDVILTDMQMPGIHGNELAGRLRVACGPRTRLLAMSGSAVAEEKLARFEGFLLKPFSADDLRAVCDGQGSQAAQESFEGVLNEAVYANFARTMPPTQTAALYAMCLDDAAKRLGTMRAAQAANDDEAYRRSAHAIKGGCGMVGAIELARLAAAMESDGIRAVYDETRLDEFAAAAATLRRMLESKSRDAGAR